MSEVIKELSKKITKAQEAKWFPRFEKQARYAGNGIYAVGTRLSTDTRELFLMFVADLEEITIECLMKDKETSEE